MASAHNHSMQFYFHQTHLAMREISEPRLDTASLPKAMPSLPMPSAATKMAQRHRYSAKYDVTCAIAHARARRCHCLIPAVCRQWVTQSKQRRQYCTVQVLIRLANRSSRM
jgi:hypothetical protein